MNQLGPEHPVNVMQAAERIASGDNEGTAAPWWAIILPRQIMRKSISQIANCVIGPFFSREDADNHRKSRIYEYGEDSGVWCFSGYYSGKYSDFAEAVVNATWKLQEKLDLLDAENQRLKNTLNTYLNGQHPARKLVRDKIPSQAKGGTFERVPYRELRELLQFKLIEETQEFIADHDPAELVDILEVVYGLARLSGITPEQLENMRQCKALEKGTFERRQVLLLEPA